MSYYFKDEPVPPPSKATREYIQEMREVVHRDPVYLIAYSQCLYMGLFFAGRVMKGWVRRAFGNEKGDGILIFQFDAVPDRERFLRQYRETLNALALTREEKDLVIERKKRVFQCNNAIFQELRQGSAYKTRVYVVLAMAFVGITMLVLLLAFLTQRFSILRILDGAATATFAA